MDDLIELVARTLAEENDFRPSWPGYSHYTQAVLDAINREHVVVPRVFLQEIADKLECQRDEPLMDKYVRIFYWRDKAIDTAAMLRASPYYVEIEG